MHNGSNHNGGSPASLLASLLAVDGAGSLFDADFLDSLSSASFARSGANTDITSLAGTATNDSAAAGKIGEYVSSSVTSGSAVAQTSNTARDLTSISLTAGDWDVSVEAYFVPANTTSITVCQASASQTSKTTNSTPGAWDIKMFAAHVSAGVTTIGVGVSQCRVSLPSTTTIYAVTNATFTVSTCTVYGIISARRVR